MKANVLLDLYLNLFEASHRSNRVDQRYHFLTLAAILAWKAGYRDLVAELCERMREIDPIHPLAWELPIEVRFSSQPMAILWRDLNETYPFEKAEYLLERYRAGGFTGTHRFAIPESLESPKSTTSSQYVGTSQTKRAHRPYSGRRDRAHRSYSPRGKRRSLRSPLGHDPAVANWRKRFPIIDPPTLELTRRAATTRQLPGSLLALLGLLLIVGLVVAYVLGDWSG